MYEWEAGPGVRIVQQFISIPSHSKIWSKYFYFQKFTAIPSNTQEFLLRVKLKFNKNMGPLRLPFFSFKCTGLELQGNIVTTFISSSLHVVFFHKHNNWSFPVYTSISKTPYNEVYHFCIFKINGYFAKFQII